jgi:hypothetical protein
VIKVLSNTTKLVTCTLVILTLFTVSFAQEDEKQFLTEYDLEYDVRSDGETTVTQNVTITNLKSATMVTSYSHTISKMQIYGVEAYSKDRKLTVNQKDDDENNSVTLTVNFADATVGEGRQNEIRIKYKSNDIATKFGEIWNITIPRTELSDSTTRYNVSLIVPKGFGSNIYVTPEPDIKDDKDGSFLYSYTKESINNQSINGSFGEYQELNFKLKYQIENPYLLSSTYEVALPPDIRGVQQVKFENIYPEPKKVFRDDDGNTLAYFRLKSNEKLEIIVTGSARISGKQINPALGGNFKDIPKDIYSKYTSENTHWETNSNVVISKSQELFDPELNVTENAKKIYDYIVNTLDYDFEVINKETIERRGAEKALSETGSNACMEFTDLFIALARSIGIPARELDGYAFTNEDSNKPLSISFSGGDLLHAWPEFYDPNLGWIQIDPTWGNTSGIDYFSKLDTNHFAFVIKGEDSDYPVPAGAYRFGEGNNNEKLVEVEFSQKKGKEAFDSVLEIKKVFNWNIIKLIQGYVKYKVTNTGNTYIYDLYNDDLAPRNSKKIYLKRDDNKIIFQNFNGESIVKEF